MRLKYFLRGLGVGVIITTLILTISHSANRKLSDNEVIERARELGMTFGSAAVPTDSQETNGETTADEPDTAKEPDTTKEPDTAKEPETTIDTEKGQEAAGQESTSVAEETEEADTTTEELQSIRDTTTEAPTTTALPQTSEPPTEQTTAQNEEPAGEVVTYTISITAGMNSYRVCQMLQEGGIIQSAVDFDNYLENSGYADKIKTGSFEVRSSMTYDELAAVFCGK